MKVLVKSMIARFSVLALVALMAGALLSGVYEAPSADGPHQEFARKKQILERELASGRIHGKPRAYLHVSIEGDSTDRTQPGDMINLVGAVRVQQAMERLDVEWVIPEGVSVVSGPLRQTLHDLAPGQITTFELTISSDSAENKQVYLKAFATEDGMKKGNVAQYNTLIQHSLDGEAFERQSQLHAKGKRNPARKIVQ